MPWYDGVTAQCPCNACTALLPTSRLLSYVTRMKHKKRFGVPGGGADEEQKDMDPPCADDVSPGNEPSVPTAPLEINVDMFAKDLVLLIVNHGVTWKAAELVVKLVNSYVLGRVLTQPLPATVYQLKKVTECRPGNAKLMHVCPVCDFVFDGDHAVCTPCGVPPRVRVKRQLLVNDVSVTIRQMFAVPKLAEALEYAFHRRPGDGDVWDGRIMRDIPLGYQYYLFEHQPILLLVTNDTSSSIG